MWRAASWCGVLALALGAWWFNSETLRIVSTFAVLAVLGFTLPPSLRIAMGFVLLGACALLFFGGAPVLFDSLAPIISALVGFMFARTLMRRRTPLIARAIAAVDGPQQLDDPVVVRYAWRLTLAWSIYQFVLAAIGAVLVVQAQSGWTKLGWMPTPRTFGIAILPGAIAALFVGEFLLRPYLLPQVPRRKFFDFLFDVVRAWPRLLDDNAIVAPAAAHDRHPA
jgi:uncharacterized membrane protein